MVENVLSSGFGSPIMTAIISLSLNADDWVPVNDGVMGGVSDGSMFAAGENGHLQFKGELSLENNGGFSSVRRLTDEDLSQADRVIVQLRGDGRVYQFRIRQDSRFDGVAWSRPFETTGDWQSIELPLSDFQPVFRGYRVDHAGPVIPERIQQIGFMLADKKPGPFKLEIRSIDFISSAEREK